MLCSPSGACPPRPSKPHLPPLLRISSPARAAAGGTETFVSSCALSMTGNGPLLRGPGRRSAPAPNHSLPYGPRRSMACACSRNFFAAAFAGSSRRVSRNCSIAWRVWKCREWVAAEVTRRMFAPFSTGIRLLTSARGRCALQTPLADGVHAATRSLHAMPLICPPKKSRPRLRPALTCNSR